MGAIPLQSLRVAIALLSGGFFAWRPYRNGYMDALVGGLAGILIGTGIFAELYPRLKSGILKKGDFGNMTLPQLFKVNDWVVVVPVAVLIFLLLIWLERVGL